MSHFRFPYFLSGSWLLRFRGLVDHQTHRPDAHRVDLVDTLSQQAAIAWWREHTERGGEEMVVKPFRLLKEAAGESSSPASNAAAANISISSTDRSTPSPGTSIASGPVASAASVP